MAVQAYVPFSRTEPIFEDEIVKPSPKSQLLRIAAPDPSTMDPRENGILLDAMPYIDSEYNDDATRAEVDKLIAQEMSQSTKSPEEYLDALGLTKPQLKLSDFVQKEFARIEENQAQKPVDISRYKVEPPPEDQRHNLVAWKKAVDNAYSQLQGLRVRLANLELSNKYGANAWKLHAENISHMQMGLDDQINECKQEIENINRKRKSEQTRTGNKLSHLEEKWLQSIHKTGELEGVCVLLEWEVNKLRTRAEKRGISTATEDDAEKDVEMGT